MTTTSGSPAHCPTCGMKIARRELSICAYCSAPIGVSGSGQGTVVATDSATAQRLGKMKEHKDYAAAMAWQPPEENEVQAALRQRRRALWLACPAAILLAWGLLLGNERALPMRPALWSAAAVGGTALLLAVRSARTTARARSMPLLRRSALVKSRRSETSPWGGRSSTVYFFELEFEDGAGEFRFPGRGAHFDPLVPGNTGLAYTRRDVLLEFKPIRV